LNATFIVFDLLLLSLLRHTSIISLPHYTTTSHIATAPHYTTPGLAALQDLPVTGIAQIVFLIGLLELGYGSRKKLIAEVHIEKAVERFQWTDEIIAEQKAKELNNGRAAMMGMLGIFVHELIGQSPFQPLL
jgi:hypothetical protein